MFELLKYSHDPTSGKVDVVVEYDLVKGGSHRHKTQFDNQALAVKWVNNTMYSVLKHQLIAYIKHKEILKAHAKTWATEQNRREKEIALEKCKGNIDQCMQYPMHYMCELVEKLKDDLYLILPEVYNSSYTSSKFKLNEIIMFCREYLYGPKKIVA
jgi:hypothetical protein